MLWINNEFNIRMLIYLLKKIMDACNTDDRYAFLQNNKLITILVLD